MATQTIKGVARLRVAAGKAAPSPAIGQALGPLGVNMMEFCKQFNDKTKHYVEEVPLNVTLTAYANRTFDFEIKTPSASWFVKRAAGIDKGANAPGTQRAGKITAKHIYEIAKVKATCPTMKGQEVLPIARQIMGTALSMGVQVVQDK